MTTENRTRPASKPSTTAGRHVRGRIGIFRFGLAAYWPRFPGLKERLEGARPPASPRVRAWDALERREARRCPHGERTQRGALKRDAESAIHYQRRPSNVGGALAD
jgi:hypothetical protein